MHASCATHDGRVVAVGEDVEEVGGRDEVEAGEGESLRLEVLGERLLAQHQRLLERLETVEQLRTVRRVHDVRRLLHFRHQLLKTCRQERE